MSNEEHDSNEQQRDIEKPEVTEEHHRRAKEMMEAYDEERPTIVLPGSGGAVAGTAVNEWVDDDGNPKFGTAEKGAAEKDGS